MIALLQHHTQFTGWVDCPLSEKGLEEAKAGGVLLKEEGFTFDKAYTSTLKRAIKTLWTVLEEIDLMYTPIVNTWRLNERHYGKERIFLFVALVKFQVCFFNTCLTTLPDSPPRSSSGTQQTRNSR